MLISLISMTKDECNDDDDDDDDDDDVCTFAFFGILS